MRAFAEANPAQAACGVGRRREEIAIGESLNFEPPWKWPALFIVIKTVYSCATKIQRRTVFQLYTLPKEAPSYDQPLRGESVALGRLAQKSVAVSEEISIYLCTIEQNHPVRFYAVQIAGFPQCCASGNRYALRVDSGVSGISKLAARADQCPAHDTVYVDRTVSIEACVQPDGTFYFGDAEKQRRPFRRPELRALLGTVREASS